MRVPLECPARMEEVAPPFRSYVLVSREQLARNYHSVRAAVGPGVEVMGVVKADAYGHGAIEVARVLLDAGVRWLAVSSVEEGVTLRGAGIRQPRILVMGGFLPHEGDALVECDLTPAVHSLAQIAMVDGLARRWGKALPYHLKIDSGMNRLGTPAAPAEVAAALAAAPHARLDGLMTHFASAADYTSLQTDHQIEYFDSVAASLREQGIRPEWLHTSSTNAIGYARREGWHNMVRAGHALYGYLSPPRGDAPPRVIDVWPALTCGSRFVPLKSGTLFSGPPFTEYTSSRFFTP